MVGHDDPFIEVHIGANLFRGLSFLRHDFPPPVIIIFHRPRFIEGRFSVLGEPGDDIKPGEV
jgi:hypothetical protein